jgi:hypothetical protein
MSRLIANDRTDAYTGGGQEVSRPIETFPERRSPGALRVQLYCFRSGLRFAIIRLLEASFGDAESGLRLDARHRTMIAWIPLIFQA